MIVRRSPLIIVLLLFVFLAACAKVPAPAEPTPTPTPAPKLAKSGNQGGGGKHQGGGEGGGKGGGKGEGENGKGGANRGGRMAEKMEKSRYALEIIKPDGTSVKIPAKELWAMREPEPIVIGGKPWQGPALVKVLEKAGIEKYKKVEFHKKDTGLALLKKDIVADPARYRLIFSRVPDLKLVDAKGNHPGVRRATHLKKIFVSGK